MGHAYLDHSRLWIVAVLFLGWGEAAMEGITLAKLFVLPRWR